MMIWKGFCNRGGAPPAPLEIEGGAPVFTTGFGSPPPSVRWGGSDLPASAGEARIYLTPAGPGRSFTRFTE